MRNFERARPSSVAQARELLAERPGAVLKQDPCRACPCQRTRVAIWFAISMARDHWSQSCW
jgi:hypothetical protein